MAFFLYLKSIRATWQGMKTKTPKITGQEAKTLIESLKKSLAKQEGRQAKSEITNWSNISIFYGKDGNC